MDHLKSIGSLMTIGFLGGSGLMISESIMSSPKRMPDVVRLGLASSIGFTVVAGTCLGLVDVFMTMGDNRINKWND